MYNLHLHIWTNIWQNRLINIRQIIISKATFPPNSSVERNHRLIEFSSNSGSHFRVISWRILEQSSRGRGHALEIPRENHSGINRVIIPRSADCVSPTVDNGAACVHPPRYAQLERERERVGSSICKRARVRAEMHTHTAVVARTRALPRIRTSRYDAPPPSNPLCFSLSCS